MIKPSKFLLILQAILTIIGAIATFVMAARLFQNSPDLLTILSSIIFIIAYLFTIIYAIKNYNGADKHYQIVVYAYAALLGIEILYSGDLIAEIGLGKNMTLLVNICNLISFAFTIKFSNILDNKHKAYFYMLAACIIKLLVECYLIIIMVEHIQLIHIITALSVPILGFTMLVAYLHRYSN